MTEKLLVNQEKCTGCRSCEVACSYHLKRTFQPSVSRIKVAWNSENGEMNILLSEGCDLCQGENESLCVKYCAPKALLHQKGEY